MWMYEVSFAFPLLLPSSPLPSPGCCLAVSSLSPSPSLYLSFCGSVSTVRVHKFIYAFLLQCISGVCVCLVWRGCTEGGNGKRCVFFDFYRALAVCASHLREYSLNNFKDLEPLFLFLFCFQESRRDKRRDVCARRRGRDGGPSSIYPSVDFLSLISVYLVSYFLF